MFSRLLMQHLTATRADGETDSIPDGETGSMPSGADAESTESWTSGADTISSTWTPWQDELEAGSTGHVVDDDEAGSSGHVVDADENPWLVIDQLWAQHAACAAEPQPHVAEPHPDASHSGWPQQAACASDT